MVLYGAVDSNSWKVLKKVYARLKFLYRKSKFLDFNTRKLLASALIQCHYDYACSYWYKSLTRRTKSKLQISQNTLIRFVLNLHPRTHISYTHFKQLGWLPIEQRVEQLKLNHVYKVLNGNAPSYLSDHFSLTSSRHSYNTRSSSSSIYIPTFNTQSQHSFRLSGAKIWNSLPSCIRNVSSLQLFKKSVKAFMYEKLSELEESEFVYLL